MLSCILLAQLLGSVPAFCVSIIVPNDLFNVEGNAAATVPFDIGTGTARYQQVYDASQFAPFGQFGGIGPGGAWITMLSFRVDVNNSMAQGFDTTLPSIQINLSTTAKAPDALSPVFAQNVGADDTIVHAAGPLSIRAGGPAGPGAWDISIPLTRPFFYLPSSGNLLMDVRNFGGGTTTFFDDQLALGDSISVVVSWSGVGGSVDSATGTTGTSGLVTLFEVTPVPEPASLSFAVLGICAVALARTCGKSARRS